MASPPPAASVNGAAISQSALNAELSSEIARYRLQGDRLQTAGTISLPGVRAMRDVCEERARSGQHGNDCGGPRARARGEDRTGMPQRQTAKGRGGRDRGK